MVLAAASIIVIVVLLGTFTFPVVTATNVTYATRWQVAEALPRATTVNTTTTGQRLLKFAVSQYRAVAFSMQHLSCRLLLLYTNPPLLEGVS